MRSSPQTLLVVVALATTCGLASPQAAAAATPAAGPTAVRQCFGTICVEWNRWGLPVPMVVEPTTPARPRVTVGR